MIGKDTAKIEFYPPKTLKKILKNNYKKLGYSSLSNMVVEVMTKFIKKNNLK